MSTPFGVRPQPSSPAAKRIAEAGYRYTAARERDVARRIETEKALESAEAARHAAEAEKHRIMARRWRLIDRFERAFELSRDMRGPREKTMTEILKEVSTKYDMTVTQIRSHRRSREIAWPRHEAMWRCYRETSHTLPEIGRFFGGFDHTTVLHAIRAHEGRVSPTNPKAAPTASCATFSDRGIK